jgi:hypothetical protein
MVLASPISLTAGEEQFEHYTSRITRKPIKRVQYDYRALDGELFSCDKSTLEACRAARDAWLEKKGKKA